MNEEEAKMLVDWAKQAWAQLKEVLRPVADAVTRLAKTVLACLDKVKKAQVRAQWYGGRTVARFLASHPDLRVLDNWLDAHYDDPVWSSG